MTTILLTVLITNCSPMGLQPPIVVTEDVDALHTAAAQTIIVQLTQSANQTIVPLATQLAVTPTETASPLPTEIPPTETAVPPTATTVPPTPTPLTPSATPILPTPTDTPVPCDLAQFVTDVTVPDYTIFNPGTHFTKTWRLKNIGNCSWNSAYALVFKDGFAMTDRSAIQLPGIVRPGEMVEISVDMVAPDKPGNYKSNWQLRNEAGRIFGVGPNADKSIWALIKVGSSNPNYAYDFTFNFCNADWKTGAGKLGCPGKSDGAKGFVVILDNPVLEHRHDNEAALWTNPNYSKDGWISGKYPPTQVKAGDRFKSWIGCLAASKGCHVIFRLDYEIAGGSSVNLGEWHEIYDEEAYQIDLDLSHLAGQNVQFILRVETVGNPEQARAFWFGPRIKSTNPEPPAQEENPAVQEALQMLAIGLGIDVKTISVVMVERVNWTDICLGIPREDMECTPTNIPGYRIIMEANNRRYEVHTNLDGTEVWWFQVT
jgi:hypothetical protein